MIRYCIAKYVHGSISWPIEATGWLRKVFLVDAWKILDVRAGYSSAKSQSKGIVQTNSHAIPINSWLVVSTPLKNISQWERLSHILWKIKNVWNHQPDSVLCGGYRMPIGFAVIFSEAISHISIVSPQHRSQGNGLETYFCGLRRAIPQSGLCLVYRIVVDCGTSCCHFPRVVLKITKKRDMCWTSLMHLRLVSHGIARAFSYH